MWVGYKLNPGHLAVKPRLMRPPQEPFSPYRNLLNTKTYTSMYRKTRKY